MIVVNKYISVYIPYCTIAILYDNRKQTWNVYIVDDSITYLKVVRRYDNQLPANDINETKHSI